MRVKKILLYITPFITAILLFLAFVFFISQRTGKGALQVTATPSSEVYLNGKLIGSTPLCKCENKEMIASGEYDLRLVRKDKKEDTYEEKITINNSTLTVVDKTFGDSTSSSVITLTPIKDKEDAQLMVLTLPTKTDVYLDDNLEGQSTLLLKDLTESDHELRITKEGYAEKTLRIKTTKGFLLRAVINLGVSTQTSTLPTIEVSPSPSVAPTSSVSKILILQTPTGFLRVRDDSSISANEIGRVSPGESYDLVEEISGWYKIKISERNEGWISSQYAQKQ